MHLSTIILKICKLKMERDNYYIFYGSYSSQFISVVQCVLLLINSLMLFRYCFRSKQFFELQSCINTPDFCSHLSQGACLFCAAGSDVVIMYTLSLGVEQALSAVVLLMLFPLTAESYLFRPTFCQNKQ
jgi:hypothetical protein